MTVILSAANTVKMSAMQLAYHYQNKVEKPVTEAMLEGSQWAEDQSKSIYKEMTSSFTTRRGAPEVKTYFSIDEIILGKKGKFAMLIEHKMVKWKPKDYYFHNSILQVAYYAALTKLSDKQFVTADFYNIGEKQELDLSEYALFHQLNFGKDKYGINVNYDPIMRFYTLKARSVLDYDLAEQFDERFKSKEWDTLKGHIEIQKVGG